MHPTNETPQLQPRSAADSQAGAFWASLHHRTCDCIAWAWARGWLQAYAHLEPGEVAGWPSLVLVLEADPPKGLLGGPDLLRSHYRNALAEGCKGRGPLAALPLTLEVLP